VAYYDSDNYRCEGCTLLINEEVANHCKACEEYRQILNRMLRSKKADERGLIGCGLQTMPTIPNGEHKFIGSAKIIRLL